MGVDSIFERGSGEIIVSRRLLEKGRTYMNSRFNHVVHSFYDFYEHDTETRGTKRDLLIYVLFVQLPYYRCPRSSISLIFGVLR